MKDNADNEVQVRMDNYYTIEGDTLHDAVRNETTKRKRYQLI